MREIKLPTAGAAAATTAAAAASETHIMVDLSPVIINKDKIDKN